MKPSKPKLTWKEVTDLDFISDIMMLQGHEDMHEKPWVKPIFCNATHAWYKLQCAHKEIETVVVEVNQVWNFIRDEEAHLRNTINNTQSTNPALTEYISLTSQYHLNANSHLHTKLLQLEKQTHHQIYKVDRELPFSITGMVPNTSAHSANHKCLLYFVKEF